MPCGNVASFWTAAGGWQSPPISGSWLQFFASDGVLPVPNAGGFRSEIIGHDVTAPHCNHSVIEQGCVLNVVCDASRRLGLQTGLSLGRRLSRREEWLPEAGERRRISVEFLESPKRSPEPAKLLGLP